MDRAKKGCKRHVICDARGLPLAIATGPANQRDDEWALTLLDGIPPCAGRHGRPRYRPDIFQGDAAYGLKKIVKEVLTRRIRPLLKPHGKKTPHGSGLGKTRWVVERALSWFGNFRRLKLCYERQGEHFQALHELAACILCAKRLSNAK